MALTTVVLSLPFFLGGGGIQDPGLRHLEPHSSSEAPRGQDSLKEVLFVEFYAKNSRSRETSM